MKKLLLVTSMALISLSAVSQTGTGWSMIRSKQNFRDSTYYVKDANFNNGVRVRESYFRIGAVTVTANGTELNILDGALVNTTELNYLVGVSGNVQTQLNNKAPVASPIFTGTPRIGSDTIATRSYARTIGSGSGGGVGVDVAGAIHDSIVNRINQGVDLEAYVTQRLQGWEGGGGASPVTNIQFIVGASNSPANGDTIFQDNRLMGKSVKLYRGANQNMNTVWRNSTATNTIPGYRQVSASGTIVVRPAFTSGERVRVEAIDVANESWSDNSNVSAIDSVFYYFALNETSGTTAVNSAGSPNGTSTATINVTGKLGRAHQFNGTNTIYVSAGESQKIYDQSVSISLWVYCTTLPGTSGNEAYLVRAISGSSPWEHIYITLYTDNKLYFYVKNTQGTDYRVVSSGTLSANQWNHVVAVANGRSSLRLYVNGSSVGTDADVLYGSISSGMTSWSIGNAYAGGDSGFVGSIDEVMITHVGLTEPQVQYLYNSGNGRTY